MYSNDIVFVNIDISGKCQYHIGSAYIAAYLKKHGLNVDIFIENQRSNIDMLAEAILKYDPEIIGFTMYDVNYYLIELLVKTIIMKSSKKRIFFVGGPTATFSGEKILQYIPHIDYCVCHEGEETVLELIDCIKNNKNVDTVEGIIYRKKNRIKRNTKRKEEIFLDKYPSPYISGIIDVKEYKQQIGEIYLFTSRGCIFECKYCVHSTMSNKKIRFHSIDRVIEELNYITKQVSDLGKPVKIQFMDDIFTYNRNRALTLCERISNDGILIEFSIQTRVDFLDTELLNILYKAGCREIALGLECANPFVLRSMNKVNGQSECYTEEKRFLQTFKEITNQAEATGIQISIFSIMGWYDESREAAINTLEFIKETRIEKVSHTYATYFPGTEGYKNIAPKAQKKVIALERQIGQPVLNINARSFPELYNYNVYDLPYLKYDMYDFALKRRKKVLQSITGVGLDGPNQLEYFISFDSIEKLGILCKRMQSNLFLDTCIVSVTERENKKIWHHAVAPLGHDLFNLNWALLNNHCLPISEKCSVKEENNIEIVRIDNMSQVENILDSICNANIDIIKTEYSVEERRFIMDFCRWYGKCPASELKRIIIKNDLIYTCFCKQSIGTVEDIFDMESLKARLEEKKRTIYNNRGCEKCEIMKKCPKCLFVDDIGEKNYCYIQKKIMNNINLRFLWIYQKSQYQYES